MVNVFFCVMILFASSLLYAHPKNFYLDHAQGWHWYAREDQEAQQKEKNESNPEKEINEKMDRLTREYDTARKLMILNPTEENVKAFIVLEQQLFNRADQVSNAWKRVLLSYPELDYNLVNPGNSLARRIQTEEISKKEEASIRLLAKTSGLFFFYSSRCSYCQGFAPTVKLFADSYQIKIIPVTLDGKSLPSFPESFVDQGQAARFHVKALPALFAVNPKAQKAFPIAYGLISLTDLRRKILEVSDQLQGGMRNE